MLQRKASKKIGYGVVSVMEGSNRWGAFISVQVLGRNSRQGYLVFPAGWRVDSGENFSLGERFVIGGCH